MSDIYMRIIMSAQTGNVLSAVQSVAGAFKGGLVPGLAAVGVAAAGLTVGLGIASVKAAGDFQQSMLKVEAYAGLTKKQTNDLGNSVLDAAQKFGVAPKQMADALYPVMSSGYNAAQAMNILSLSAKTSAASGASLSTVADMLTTSLKASGAPASQAGHYMDMFNKIVSLGKGEVPQYAATIGKLTLAAGGAKIPFDQMGAALATLTTHGFPSVAQASTALGNLFTQIGPKVDTLAAHAKKLGLSFDENAFKSADLSGKLKILQAVTHGNDGQLLKLLGGSTLAKKAFDALSKSGKDLTSNMDAMKNSAGATDAAYQTASSGFKASMARMSAAGQVLLIKIGSGLLPILTKLADFVTTTIVPGLMHLGDTIGKTLGPLFQQLGKWLSQIDWGSVAKQVGQLVIDFSPLGETIQAVISHGKDLSDWFNNSVVPAINQAKPGFKQLGDALAGLLPAFQQIAQSVHDNFQTAFTALLPVFKQVVPIVIQLAGLIAGGLGAAIKFLTPYIVQAAQAIGKFASDIAVRVAPILSGFFKELNKDMPAIKAIWNAVWPSLSITFQATWNAIVGTIKIAWAIVSGIINIGLDIMGGNWKQAWEDFKTMLSGIWDGIETIFRGAIQQLILGFKPLFQMLANIPGPVGDMAKNVLKSMNSMNTGVSQQTAQMKAKVLLHTAQMHIEAAQQIDLMRQKIVDQIKNTSDPVQKKVLEMKLKSVSHMEDMQKQAALQADFMAKKVIGSTQSMSDQVVGHSIIPDMVNNVVQWFSQLPSRVGAWVQSMASTVTGKLNGLAGSALTAGASIVNNVAAGIRSAIGNVTSAIGSVAQTIADYMPHSPARRGPLTQLNSFGTGLVNTFARDITSTSPRARAAAEQMMSGVANSIKSLRLQIVHADLIGNYAQAKALRAQRHQDELLMRKFRDLVILHGYRMSTLDPNNPINFAARATRAARGVRAAGGVSGASSSGAMTDALLQQIIVLLGQGFGISTAGGVSSIPYYTERGPAGTRRSGRSGGGVTINNYFNINTTATSRSELKHLTDAIEREMGKRVRADLPGYSSGGVF